MKSQTLKEWRDLSDIDAQKLGELVLRGPVRWNLYKNLENKLIQAGVRNDPSVSELSRDEQIARAHELTHAVYTNAGIDNINGNYVYESTAAFNLHMRGSIGSVMVTQLLLALGTEEQKAIFLPSVNDLRWTTAYAQTELGHGSDIESMKTTATYDPETDQFVFNTPTLDAIKWWPGDLGISATHAVVAARLISGDKDYGVQLFFIQLREFKTLKLLPGIETGDIGPKLGYASKDSGFMKLTNHRAPRVSLLAKYIKVSKKGEVSKTGNEKIKYSAMMWARTIILMVSYYTMFRHLTIAVRYSIIRTQFKDSAGKEIRLIDYQLQKFKLTKHLARAYATSLGLYKIMSSLRECEEAVINKGDFSLLQENHVLLCQCKAFYTWWDHECAKELINACGGHGYSAYSGMTSPFLENFANQILEGENTLLCLQVARFLVALQTKILGGKVEGAKRQFAYLANQEQLKTFKAPDSKEQLASITTIVTILQKNSAFFVDKVTQRLLQSMSEGENPKETVSKRLGVEMLHLAKCHAILTISEAFFSKVRSLEKGTIKTCMESLAVIFTYHLFNEYSSTLVESDSLNASQLNLFTELLEEHIEKVTPHLLVLAEAPQIPDEILASAIGHSNGKPYKNLYSWAKQKGMLNNTRLDLTQRL